MDTTNWNDVADKIRARKFSEIPTDTWCQIADKIEPKKRGRKPKVMLPYREDWSLDDLPETEKLYASIVAKYDYLLINNVPSKKAISLIADNLDKNGENDLKGPKVAMTAKNVERIVYEWIKEGKELNKMMEEESRLEK